MREIDRQTCTARGISEYELMCEAGQAAFHVLASQWPEARHILVLCGTGNNGGDGWVLARLAHDAGYDCRVALFGDPSRIAGTARIAHDAWRDSTTATYSKAGSLSTGELEAESCDIVIDALTGIGLSGPPRDAFVELVMRKGAKKFEGLAALRKADGKKAFRAVADAVREDGRFVEAGENDNLIVQKLEANENALGIFGFSFLDQNADKIKGAVVDGNEPTFENITSGDYPVSRSLFFYVKKEHVGVIPGIAEFVAEFTSEDAAGEEGYLVDKGLIPLPIEDLEQFAEDGAALTPLKM